MTRSSNGTSTILTTERLVVRTWADDDAEAAFAVWGDARVMHYVGDPHPDVSRTRLALQRAREVQATQGFCVWALESKLDGVVLGCCGFHDAADDDVRTLELVFHLGRDHWGQGLASEAARACVIYAFDALEAEQVIAGVRHGNDASVRLLERIGFMHLADEIDERIYKLTPGEMLSNFVDDDQPRH